MENTGAFEVKPEFCMRVAVGKVRNYCTVIDFERLMLFKIQVLEVISKKRFWLKIAAEPSFKPEEYISISRI